MSTPPFPGPDDLPIDLGAPAIEEQDLGLSRRQLLGSIAAGAITGGASARRHSRRSITRTGPPRPVTAHSSGDTSFVVDPPAQGGPTPTALGADVGTGALTTADIADLMLGLKNKEPGYIGGFQSGPDITLNGVHVRPLQVEHDQRALDAYGSQVVAAIEDADVIVPEYFPSEYGSAGGPVAAARAYLAQRNALFPHVDDACADKDVWVLDPAHDGRFIAFTLIPGLSEGPLRIVTPYVAAYGSGLPFPVAIGFASSVPALLIEPAFKETVANDLRRVAVAQNLHDLCHSGAVPQGSTVLVIYPPGHWMPPNGNPGIERYLRDGELRERRLSMYKKVLGGTTMLKPRHYPDGICEGEPNYADLPSAPAQPTPPTAQRRVPKGPDLSL
jgi:hypothetical protein